MSIPHHQHWQLTIVSGPEPGRTIDVQPDEPTVVGRGSQSHTRIKDPLVSRVHCVLRWNQGQLELIDLGGSAGTFLDGIRISDPTQVKHGTLMSIGDTTLRIDSGDALDSGTVRSNPHLPKNNQQREIVKRIEELEGEVFLRFRLGKKISSGRNSVVFKGVDLKRDRDVAVKILKPQMAVTDVQRDRFIRAMRTMLPVKHPHIVRTRKAGRNGPFCWAVFDWVEGVSVAELIDMIGVGGMLDWKEVWKLAVHITRALEEAHQREIVHRNVTPSNILRRGEDKSYLLTDLIFARALEYTESSQLTRPGEVLGELGYMSPERVIDSTTLDARSDQYGLGATLYALLTGGPPFKANSVSNLIETIKNEVPVSPTQVRMGVDERFCDVVMKTIKPSPLDRYRSASHLLKDLNRVGELAGLEPDDSFPWVG